MEERDKSEIIRYIQIQSRNKLVFYQKHIAGITSIDLGLQLSQAIYGMTDLTKLPMKVWSELEKILDSEIIEHTEFGRLLAISNIGILFEKELKIDFNAFLTRFSKTNVLFVKWEGEIDNDHLYFLSKEKGITTNINNLSHIVI